MNFCCGGASCNKKLVKNQGGTQKEDAAFEKQRSERIIGG